MTAPELDTVVVTAVWLQKTPAELGHRLRVLVEIDGVWRCVLTETADDGPISHCVHAAGMVHAPQVTP